MGNPIGGNARDARERDRFRCRKLFIRGEFFQSQQKQQVLQSTVKIDVCNKAKGIFWSALPVFLRRSGVVVGCGDGDTGGRGCCCCYPGEIVPGGV